jgi:hypothetical protein
MPILQVFERPNVQMEAGLDPNQLNLFDF